MSNQAQKVWELQYEDTQSPPPPYPALGNGQPPSELPSAKHDKVGGGKWRGAAEDWLERKLNLQPPQPRQHEKVWGHKWRGAAASWLVRKLNLQPPQPSQHERPEGSARWRGVRNRPKPNPTAIELTLHSGALPAAHQLETASRWYQHRVLTCDYFAKVNSHVPRGPIRRWRYCIWILHCPPQQLESQNGWKDPESPWLAELMLGFNDENQLLTQFPWRNNIIESCHQDYTSARKHPYTPDRSTYRRVMDLAVRRSQDGEDQPLWGASVRVWSQDIQWLAGLSRADIVAMINTRSAFLCFGEFFPAQDPVEPRQLFYHKSLSPSWLPDVSDDAVNADHPHLRRIVEENIDKHIGEGCTDNLSTLTIEGIDKQNHAGNFDTLRVL
ncbi:hypothetical protein B0T25DRAFT_262250 [Lasiosphaeria hispida]|uniref:Uncharacterized protein n=1 Tax=Lasiosphaeria hispida TaxID=260671 RepID=A0AAJ0MD35_9PEZI|nr:hypothetical protein B0T25DRAFT_262250 [Lasiosphaeria hispida]